MADLTQFSADDLAYMKAKGIDPNTVSIVQPSNTSTNSKTSTIGKTLKAHAGGILGGGAGTLGALGLIGAPETGGLSLALPLLGAIGGGIAGGYGGQKLQEAVTPTDVYERQQQEAQQAAQENPKTALATDIIGSALASGGKPSADAIKGVRGLIGKLAGKALSDTDKSALMGTVLNAGINPAINTGISAATGQPISGQDVGAQVLGGALFSKQANWASKLIGHPNVGEPTPELNNNEKQPLVSSPGEQETQFTAKDKDGNYNIGNKNILPLYMKKFATPIPKDADDITKAYIRTQNENLKSIPRADMRQALHQDILNKTVLPISQEDKDYKGGELPEVNNDWESGVVKPNAVPNQPTPEESKPIPPLKMPEFNPSDEYMKYLDSLRSKYTQFQAQEKYAGPTVFKQEFLQGIIDRGITKPIAVQRAFPKLNISMPDATEALRQADLLAELHINRPQQIGEQNATGIRENTGLPNQTGQVGTESKVGSSSDLVDKTSGSGESIPQKVGGVIPEKETVKPIAQFDPEEEQRRLNESGEVTPEEDNKPEYIGTQQDMSGKGNPPIHLYNLKQPIIDASGKVISGTGSTVSEGALKANNIPYEPPTKEQQATYAIKAAALAEKLNALKSGINSKQVHAFGIVPLVWDKGIELAQNIIRSGGKVIDGVNAFIQHLKTNSKTPFNEQAVRDHVTKQLQGKTVGLKDTPESQNLPPDKYMGKVGSITRAVIDKIRDIGSKPAKLVGNAMQQAVDRETELKGKWKNLIVQAGEHLTPFDKQRVKAAFDRELETGKPATTMLTNAAQRQFYNIARQKLDESGKYRLNIGEPVTQTIRDKNGNNIYIKRNLIQDQTYMPGMANQKVMQVYRDNTDHAKIDELNKEFHDYNTKVLGLTDASSKERIANFKVALQGSLRNSDISHQDYFNAHRKAQGTPLPPSFREQDPVRNLERYFDRASIDASHYEFMEKPRDVLSALGQTKDAWGNKVEPLKEGAITNNPAVKAGLEHWRGTPVSPAEGNESSLSSLISSAFIAGPALEVHKVVSNVVKSLGYTTNPVQLVSTLMHGLANIQAGYQHAVENGVVKLTARSASQMLSGSSTAAERLQSLARVIRRVSSLNDITTKFGAGLVQAMNEVIIPSKILRANNGDVTSQLFLRRLDPTYVRGKQYSDLEQQQLASRSANYIHGTGDIRSLPAWMLNDSEFSGFFSLAHWSIAQTNNFMKDIYEPATRGDIRPLLTGVFGAAIGGYLIKELRQDIQGKKSPIPSLQEIAASDRGLEGNKGLLAYNLIAAMQYSGFGGLLSQIAKYPFDFAYKNNPQGATFPMDEVASDMASTLHYVSGAIANDPNINWVDLAKAVSMHVLSTNFQLGRIAINQSINNGLITGLPAEKKELSDKVAQLRRFDMTEGLPYNDIDEASNPYMNIEQKKFKSEQDIGTAVKELPELIQNIIQTYGSKPDVMMQKFKALKQNDYSTFPSMEGTPLSFYKYVSYLNKEEGPEQAQAALMDYMKHKAINEAKSSAIP